MKTQREETKQTKYTGQTEQSADDLAAEQRQLRVRSNGRKGNRIQC